MEKNKKYIVKCNLVTYNNEVIEDDSYEFDTKEKANNFINMQVDILTCSGLYNVLKQSDDYVVLNSYDREYSTRLFLIEKNIFS